MAYNQDNLGRWSVSYNSIAPTEWGYNGDSGVVSDILDVITADGYFNDAPASYLRVGDLIYIKAVEVNPALVSHQTVVVRTLNPTTVRPINGESPIFVVVHEISTTAATSPFTQVFGLPGLIVGDFPVINFTVNPADTSILTVTTGVDTFTIRFKLNPGAGCLFDGIFFRQSFS